MTDDPRVQQLLDELLDSQSTPEMVCESCPELLPVVRDRWRQMCRVRAELDALFPPPDEPTQRFALLDARFSAIRTKSEKPASADEQIEFARQCLLKKLYATATRLYADAFAMKPQLAEEPSNGYRYDAACSAALAGCGRGEDGAERGDAERARWRAQARQWLRADLDAWAKKLESGLAADRAGVHEKLAWWREDPDLAGLRDPDALEKLPPAERQECRALWNAVAALARK